MSGSLGASIQFSAVEKNAYGDPVSGQAVTWTSSDSTIVAVSQTGLAVNVGIGTATITATAGNSVAGAATQDVVGAAPVASVAVLPTQVNVGLGQTARFAATLADAAGNVLTGRRVLWQSSNPAILRVDSLGTATAATLGTATVIATSAGVTGVATAVVTNVVAQPPGAVSDLTVVATTDSSATVQFTQATNGSGGTTSYDVRVAQGTIDFNATPSVTHGTCSTPFSGTGAPGKLTCTILGLAPSTAFSVQLVAFTGTLNVNAVLGALSNIATGTTLSAVASVAVSPATASTSVGGAAVQFAVVLKDASGNVLASQPASWISNNPTVATVTSSGVATGLSAGAATITATVGSITSAATLTVSGTASAPSAPGSPSTPSGPGSGPSTPGAAASVIVTPGTSAAIVGLGTLQFTAVVKDASGNVLTNGAVMWSSSNTAVATISSSGLATGVSGGSTTITATSGAATTSVSLSVSTRSTSTSPATTPGTVSNLSVASMNDTTATLSFTAASDGNGGVASVDVRYAVAPISWGSATSVTRGTCASGNAGATVGSTVACTVLGLTKGTSYNFELVTYRGTLNQNAVFGAVSNIASGTTTATSATTPTAPAAPVVGSVTVTPSTAAATIGVKLQLSVTVKDKNNNVLTGQQVIWSSNNNLIATVDTTGAVMGVAVGTATLTATVGTVTGTATVVEAAAVITAPITPPAAPSGPSALYPNQPAGFTPFAEINFSSLPGLAGAAGVISGNWWNYQDSPTHLTIQNDPTAPQSAPSVLQIDFETGTQPGYDTQDQSTRAFGGWATPNFNGNETTYSEIYESTRFKLPGTNFENQEVGAKILGYWGVGENNTGGTPTQVYSQMRGNGSSTALGTAFPLDLKMQGTAYAAYPQNMNLGTLITVGVWHQFEVHMKLNDIGSSNGVMDWWLDGVQIGHYTNVVFRTAQYPSGFWGRQYDPVWGGGGGTAKTRTDYLWIDHTYLSGVP